MFLVKLIYAMQYQVLSFRDKSGYQKDKIMFCDRLIETQLKQYLKHTKYQPMITLENICGRLPHIKPQIYVIFA